MASRRKKSTLPVHLCDPQAGWIEVAVETPAFHFCEPVSCTPNDFVDELIAGLNLSMHGQPATARASCEPTTFEFAFSPGQCTDGLSFQIVRHANWGRSRGKGQAVLFFQGTRRAVVLSFWRALKALEGRVNAGKYREAMRREFPAQKLRTLSKLPGKD